MVDDNPPSYEMMQLTVAPKTARSPQDRGTAAKNSCIPTTSNGYNPREPRLDANMSTEGMAIDEDPATQSITSKSISAREPRMTNKKPPRTYDFNELPNGRGPQDRIFVEDVETEHLPSDLILSRENRTLFEGLVREYRHSDQLKRHGLISRSRLLFCGPPGCGKTLAAEIFAVQSGLPFRVVRIDALVSSFLGETATNLRRVFEEASRRPSVLFLDEFDAIAHTRLAHSENSEMRRVVNALLLLIESHKPPGVMIAATNIQDQLDRALWRRFDEVIFFDLPSPENIREMLALKTRNFPAEFDISKKAVRLRGLSYADIERICTSAIKLSILDGERRVSEKQFDKAVHDERRRQKLRSRLEKRSAK